MEISSLEKIGLNKNESIIYLQLINLGKATAGELIKKTEFHRNIVYDNLEKLIDKGLVSFIIEESIKVFQIANPQMISEYINKQQKTLDEKKKIAKLIQEEIQQQYNVIENKQEATIYRGIKGIKLIMKDILKSNFDYLSLGAPIESNEIMSEPYWKNFAIKQKETKTYAKLLFNSSLRNWGEKVSHEFNEIKYLTQNIEPLTQTIVYGNKVAIIVWSKKPIVTMINDVMVAKSYTDFFNLLWKNSKY